MAKIVTANMLATGTVVFLGKADDWVHAIDDARTFVDAAAAEDGLARAERDAQAAIVVDPFVTDKIPGADGKPGITASGMTLRDTIRAFGPTVRFLPAETDAA